ncbi:hypothetical protein BKA67DRAFT_684555 [Truncatella angustata]|uniref:Glucose receptor Git3 N-terminal domain-containing protein n=1 Tax=Truncatella angustata TaxID=152316 RepID=A0A9P8RN52_9PEZI|nr:uncharacterized protein BKA67DRAFT_684555 [Truncatella angustata]KAH6647041.1 hypothetical protein BKA67DRAFT_684555 [Truncatella angustata]
MDDQDDFGKLARDSDTLSPLPNSYRTGLIAVGTAALISFISTTTLFLFLSYKLVAGNTARWRQPTRAHATMNDLNNLDLPVRHYPLRSSSSQQLEADSKQRPPTLLSSKEKACNPFPLFIYHLLFAEMQTALGYTLNLEWVMRDGIYVGTTTCWAQGWLNSIGVLSSSVFLISISVNTYLSVVRGWRPPQCLTHIWIALCWVLVLCLTFAGIIRTNNGAAVGGWFVRANTWCWVNATYSSARLWSEWAWILCSIPLTILLYSAVFWSLYSENRSSRHLPGRLASHGGNMPSGHHPAFLVYPFIYILCTSPLAIARLITISGGSPSATYYYIAGLTLATNGFWNTILWSTTIIYSTPEDMRNTGLDDFAFIRTPTSRRYGNMVWINGPGTQRSHAAAAGDGSWWWWKTGGATRRKRAVSRNTSQESLRGGAGGGGGETVPDNCIHLDVITTVVVEENVDTVADTIHSANTSTSGEKLDQQHVSGSLVMRK